MMDCVRESCALLLAFVLIASGVNAFLGWMPPLDGQGHAGAEVLAVLREAGLLQLFGIGHAVLGSLVLVKATRWIAALLQVPVSAAILAFNATLFPPGLPLSLALSLLNLGALSRAPVSVRTQFTTTEVD